MLLGVGEEKTGGRERESIMADMFEAFIGALYLDSGYESACKILESVITPHILAPKSENLIDYKTKLQEYVQKNDKGALPIYNYLTPHGESHCPEFVVRVTAMGKTTEGRGQSKKAASIAAADEMLKVLAIS